MWIYLTISFCFSKQKLKKTIIIKLPHLLQVLQTPVSHCLPFSQAKETKKRSKFGAIVISIKNYVPNKVTAFAVTAHLTRTFWCCCFCTFWRKYLGQASRMSKDIHKFCAKIESTSFFYIQLFFVNITLTTCFSSTKGYCQMFRIIIKAWILQTSFVPYFRNWRVNIIYLIL